MSKNQSRRTEFCVLCNKDTGVPVNTDVEFRACYVDGAGQLCSHCYKRVYKQ